MFLDIHSHILPCIDDGAKNMTEALELLKIMGSQGVTDVIATSHFYADCESLESYCERTSAAYNELLNAVKDQKLPDIHLGCEVLYFHLLLKDENIKKLCLGNSDYILIELADNSLNEMFFKDIIYLKDTIGVNPIIAHIERYRRSPKYKKLLKFIKDENIAAQINAASLCSKRCRKTAEKLIKKGYISFIASDAHSVDERPPRFTEAFDIIEKKLGKKYSEQLINNSAELLKLI